MPNENCLEGLRCPKCGQEDRLWIPGYATYEVTDDGAEPLNGEFEYDESGMTECPDCRFKGKLKKFREKGARRKAVKHDD